MNQEVPQPTTAIRSPGAGSTPATRSASSAAWRQQAGCEAISCSVRTPTACVNGTFSPITKLISSDLYVSASLRLTGSRPSEARRSYRADEVPLRDEEDDQHGDQAHDVACHQEGPLRAVRSLERGQ